LHGRFHGHLDLQNRDCVRCAYNRNKRTVTNFRKVTCVCPWQQLEDFQGVIRIGKSKKTDNTMAKRKRTKGQTTIYKAYTYNFFHPYYPLEIFKLLSWTYIFLLSRYLHGVHTNEINVASRTVTMSIILAYQSLLKGGNIVYAWSIVSRNYR
jgi:hypothetical protein